jgi:hypothetical protein
MIWDIRVLDVNEAVIKKYVYTKKEFFLKITVDMARRGLSDFLMREFIL